MRTALLVITIIFSLSANAEESGRLAKIAKIVEAQGLHLTFQQQLDHSSAAACSIGTNIYRKMLADKGITQDQGNPRLSGILAQYLERCGAMFSTKELVDMWSSFYGPDLTDSDLNRILAYYKSSAGKKDAKASRLAMARFSQVMTIEAEKRMNASIHQLTRDLLDALAK